MISAFWYRDAESTAKLMEVLASEAGKPILEDELTFMDKPANRFFPVSERLLVDGEEGDVHDWILFRKPEALDRSDASKVLVRDHLPGLMKACEGLRFALLRDAFPTQGGEIPWNAVLQLGGDGVKGLEDRVAGLEGRAERRRRPDAPTRDGARRPSPDYGRSARRSGGRIGQASVGCSKSRLRIRAKAS